MLLALVLHLMDRHGNNINLLKEVSPRKLIIKSLKASKSWPFLLGFDQLGLPFSNKPKIDIHKCQGHCKIQAEDWMPTFSSPACHISPFGHAPFTSYPCAQGTLCLAQALCTRSGLLCLTLATKHQWCLVRFRYGNNILRFRK